MLESFTPSFFKRLQQLKIHTRRTFLGSRQGGHLSLRRGHGLEFADYRLYASGDDFRHIDWGIYGRTDRLYVKQYREEQDLNVFFLIDSSKSMAFPEQENKFGMCIDLALALGYVALSDGDSVTFSILGQKNSPHFVGAKSLPRVAKFLETIEPEGTFDLPLEVGSAVQRQRTPGKCFFISDFLYKPESTISALKHLIARNFEVVLLQVLAKSELDFPWRGGDYLAEDSETGEAFELVLDSSSKKDYTLALASHIEQIETFCRRSNILHILVSAEEKINELVLKRLPELGLLK